MSSSQHHRPTTTPPPRPTTPLRPSSRTSLRSSTTATAQQSTSASSSTTPLDSLEPQFAELSDSLSDLESNLMHLQLMHESLSRFSENFAAFLYGLEMNAFVVDWPEQPLVESYARWKVRQRSAASGGGAGDGETTMLLKTPTRNAALSSSGGVTVGHEVDSTLLSDTTFASLRATPRRRTIVPDTEKDGGTRQVARGGRGAVGNTIAQQKQSSLPARSGSSASRGGARGGAGAATGARGTGLPMRGSGRARGTR